MSTAASLSAVKSLLEKTRQTFTGVSLNEQAINQIDRELMENGILASLLDKIILHVFQSGVTIRLRVAGREVQLNEQTQQFFNSQWVPELKKVLRSSQKYGVAPIVYVPFRKQNGERIVIPRVPMEGTWGVRFTINEHGLPDYVLVRKHAVVNASNSRVAPGPWEGSRVFETDRPSIDGRLNSVVQKVLGYALTLRNMWKNYDSVTDELAHPPYILNAAGMQKKSSGDEPGDLPLGETDAGLSEQESTREFNDFSRSELQRAREISAASNMGITRDVYDSHTQTHQKQQVKQPWEVRKWDLPAGVAIASNFPRPSIPSEFGTVVTELITIMSNIIGIPDQITTQSGRNFAASANLAQRQFNDLIKSFQEQLIPIIQTMFFDVYGEDHAQFVSDVVVVEEQYRGTPFDDSSLRRFSDDVEVIPVFNNVPDVTFDVLRQLFMDNLIPMEEYAKQTFRLFGICEADSCLNKRGTFFSDLNISGSSGDQERGTQSSGTTGSGGDAQKRKPAAAAGDNGGKAAQPAKKQRVDVNASAATQAGNKGRGKASASAYYALFDIDPLEMAPSREFAMTAALTSLSLSSSIPPLSGISHDLTSGNLTMISSGVTDYNVIRNENANNKGSSAKVNDDSDDDNNGNDSDNDYDNDDDEDDDDNDIQDDIQDGGEDGDYGKKNGNDSINAGTAATEDGAVDDKENDSLGSDIAEDKGVNAEITLIEEIPASETASLQSPEKEKNAIESSDTVATSPASEIYSKENGSDAHKSPVTENVSEPGP